MTLEAGRSPHRRQTLADGGCGSIGGDWHRADKCSILTDSSRWWLLTGRSRFEVCGFDVCYGQFRAGLSDVGRFGSPTAAVSRWRRGTRLDGASCSFMDPSRR